jgi:hypothetical protein
MNSLLRLAIVSTVALVVVGLIGCGAGGTSSSSGEGSPPPQQTALVTGSWSGTLTSNSNNGTSQVFANVQSQGAGLYFSTMQQTTLCDVNFAACMATMPQNMSTVSCSVLPCHFFVAVHYPTTI